MRSSSNLAVYSTFKRELEPERYLETVNVNAHRCALSRLRCSSHVLEIEKGRHKDILMADRVCPLCKVDDKFVLEDEQHFVMCCPSYEDLRHEYDIGLSGR